MNAALKSLITLAESARVNIDLTVAPTGIQCRVWCVRGNPIVSRETHAWIDHNEKDPERVLTEACKRVQ